MKQKLVIFLIGCMVLSIGCKKEHQEPLKAVFSFAVNGNNVNFFNLTDLGNVNEPYATYQWSFGDGEESEERDPSHEYENPGTYEVTLTAVKSGVTSSFTDSVIVE